MDDTAHVVCPYCYETVELYVDPESAGELVQDCDVCCRPWTLRVSRSADGTLAVLVDRAQ
ncbi:MAG: CPXCG motif-containing cysteine-rich protein [Sandaracinaceae bacterium]